jgi:methylthioxylose transferase
VAAAALLVVLAAVAGWRLIADGVDIFLGFPPLLASWLPHVGPGTAPAIVVAGAVVTAGPGLAARLRWTPLMLAGWGVSVAWTTALALVDGWAVGIVGRLTTDQEYLFNVPDVHGIGAMLRGFAGHILTDQPVHWTTHVGGHPPGAFLVFVWLDRLGLPGGGPAGMLCILVGASTAPAIAVALRALGAEDTARRMLPFAVLTPAAVWVGVSADGMFAGVLAWSVALLALGCADRGWRADLASLGAGVLGGFTLYLSYGLVLGGLILLAVVALTRRVRAAGLAVLGGLAVVAAFTASGFWWFTGYRLVKIIYAGSIAKTRPYDYFWWADLAALMFVLGPAVLAGLRRLAGHPRAVPLPASVLVAAALAAIVVADISGLSKGEVERIWLPFAVWLTPACALLPHRQQRGWLVAQGMLALAVNHLLLTVW